jgi:hypothetical protein
MLVGAPGSGKTTALLMACRDQILLRTAKESTHVPIVARLAGWEPENERPLTEWLCRSNPTIDPSTIRGLIEEQRAYLFLDGLDEIRSVAGDDVDRHRKRFLSIVKYHGPILITCRESVFDRMKLADEWRTVIRVRSLSYDEVIKAIGDNQEFLLALKGRPKLFSYIATPLFCNLFSGTSSKDLEGMLGGEASDEELCFRLLDRYLVAIINREAGKAGNRKLADQVLEFLDWIAMLDAGGGGNVNTFVEGEVVAPAGGPVSTFLDFAERCGLVSRATANFFSFSSLVFRDHFAVRGGIAGLGHKDPGVRDRAAWALWQVPNRVAVPALLPALSDEYKYARGSAISALGAIGDPRGLEGIRRLSKDHTRVSSIYGRTISDVAGDWLSRIGAR